MPVRMPFTTRNATIERRKNLRTWISPSKSGRTMSTRASHNAAERSASSVYAWVRNRTAPVSRRMTAMVPIARMRLMCDELLRGK
jgi:hypothetical protein